jgi:hypothetical protein
MIEETTPYDILTEKWEPVLEHNALPSIEDTYKKKVTAVLLENQEAAIRQQRLVEDNTLGGALGGGVITPASTNIAGYDPILISLVRRAMPNLIAYDICGVQPMTAPTGLIFAMRPKYDPAGGTRKEALFQEPFVPFGGSGGTNGITSKFTSYPDTNIGSNVGYGLTIFAGETGGTRDTQLFNDDFKGLLVGDAESLGGTNGKPFQEMAFTIDKVAVQAKTRALKADYTTELAQDLKAVHGLDAETELANILSTEILAEINREVVRSIYHVAKLGAKQRDLSYYSVSTNGGVYDLLTDSDGRWSAERFRGLMFQIEREANVIAKETRRGKGNFIICSSDVASALAMGGWLNISPALNVQLEVDDTGNTFAGILNGKMRVYIDPYVQSGVDFVCMGYRGSSPYDAGLFYCPYVPLQMVRAVDPDSFQPKIGFKTRYGMVANPFVTNNSGTADGESLTANLNQYYRIFRVLNLHGNTN